MADIQFGQFSGRHNYKLGEIQIDRIYLGENAVWINEVMIIFANFPDNDVIESFTGIPGESASGVSISWTISAPSGQAFNGAQSVSGLDTSNFTFTGGNQGSTSHTTSTLRISFNGSIYPNNTVVVDYNDLTFTTPTTAVVTNSVSFSGSVSGTGTCTAFSGQSCTASVSTSAGPGSYFTANNGCSIGCSASTSGSASSSCNPSLSTASQDGFLSADIVCNIPFRTFQPEGNRGIYSCHRFIATSGPSSYCQGIQPNVTSNTGQVSGLGFQTNCTGSNPPVDLFNTNGWNTIRNAGSNPGTWSVGFNRTSISDSCTQIN